MSRYSLRQTPRKKELFDGMVETPVRSTRRRGQPAADGSDADADSSAAETLGRTRSQNRRIVSSKFKEEHLDSDNEADASPELTDSKPKTNGNGRHATPPANGAAASSRASSEVPVQERLIDGWAPGLDPKKDYSVHYDFGGPLGTSAMMLGFPLLMWFMWIGATYYDGKVPSRAPGQGWADFFRHLASLVYHGAFPTAKAWAMYWSFFIFELACYYWVPGVWGHGKPLRHEGGKQLPYYCSGFLSFYATIAIVATLHFSGIFSAAQIIDDFGSLLSVSILSGFGLSIAFYVSARLRGREHRMTGNVIYDFFMGAELNPRLFGLIDMKMFFEVRLPWFILFLISVGAAARQYETYGYVSAEVCFILVAHYLYTNACAKGEELIISTWDMYYEKLGFMLTFWNMSGVPLSYCHCSIYLALHDPAEYRWNRGFVAGLMLVYLFVYWVWDSANSQKSRFKAMERGKLVIRRTFPQLPYQTIHNPKVIKTDTGDNILVDGWYGKARKIHYACDIFFSLSWGLITGFSSPFPWFYPVFFCAMITHRFMRDVEKCRAKYGEAWMEYERQVPYKLVPYVF